MATEADVPEAISIATGEKVDRSLKIEKLDRNDNQCSPGTLNESKGDLDQHPEIHTEKHFADGDNVQIENSMEVEGKNNSFGISEGEQFLNPLSEISQVEQSNQEGMEIPKNDVQLQKGTQVGGPVETGTEENEVTEERREKFAEDIENHDIAIGEGIISEITKTGNAKFDVEEVEASTNETNVDQHVQVISNQQDSIKEDVQCLEKEAEISDADIKGAEKADGNAQSYHKEASDRLEATTFQEYEASTSTHDVTNSSFKKNIELETNVTSNEEEDSHQTLQDYEQKEELQALPEVTPVDAKIEMAFENAEVISCTEEARAIQNTPEFLEKEEANPVHYPKESDSITEKVSEATSIEQETVEHALPEIQTAENQPQEFSEEKSREYQASVVAADLSTDKDEKNLAEQAIQENSFSLVEEETAQQLPREEVQATNLKEEEKEADTKSEEPIEVADTTTEKGFETIEQKTEINKDLYVPIPEEEAYAEESTKAFVEDNSFLSEVIELKTKEIIQEDHSTVSGYGLVSGEESQVSALEEAEAESKEHVSNTPEQKGPQTILTDETVVETEDHAQAGENYNSETIEKDIQTAEDEGNADTGTAPAAGLATIVPDQPALHIEDIELQTEENVNSKDKSEEQIPAAAYESGKGLIEAETKSNEQVTDTDIASEEKDPETTLTDATALDSKDIDVQEEGDLSSEENLEKHLPVVEDKGDTCLKEAEEEKKQETLPTTVTREPPVDIEVIDVQAEESFSPKEKLEELIPAAADEGDTGLKEDEEENKEQVKSTDSAPEEKITILTDDRALDIEEVELQVEDNVGSKDNVEEQFPKKAEEGDAGLKEPEEDSKEPVSIIDISPEEKGLETILTDETTQDAEDTDAKAGECINSKESKTESCSTEPQEENKEKVSYTDNPPEEKIENLQEQLEEQVQVVADEGYTCLNEAEEENKQNIKSKETSPEEKGLPIISTDGTALDGDETELQSEENVSSTDDLEKHIPTPADEAERGGLTEAESEYKDEVTITDITPEVDSVPTIFTDQTALESEEIELCAEENVILTDNLEKELPTADEGEDILTEDKAESKEQVTITDVTPEVKGVATILTDERSLETEDTNVQAKESANSNENLEEEITAALELGDTCLKKENEEENKEQVESSSHEEKGLATILTEEMSQDLEYTDASENFNSEEILEKQIPTAAYEGETDLKEVEAENKEQVETTEIATEEKGLPTILVDESKETSPEEKGLLIISTDGTALDSDETELQSEENVSSTDNLEKHISTPADKAEQGGLTEAESEYKEQVAITDITPEVDSVPTIFTDQTALESEEIELCAEENVILTDNLEKELPTTADEGEDILTEDKAESKEQVTITDVTPEVKGVATILTDERSLETEDTNVRAKESANSNENLEEEITAALELGDTCLKKENEEENKEQVESSSHEEKGLATILTEEMSQDLEYTDASENFNSEEILEKQIPTAAYEGETDLKEVEAENKEQVETTEIATEEKGLPTILVDETAKGIEVIDVQAGEINSKEVLEKQIPTALNEGETDLNEAEADIKEQVETTDIVPDQKGVETILSDDRALDLEDVHVQEQENLNLNENLESQIPTTVGEGETDLSKGEVANKEEVKCTEIAAEVKDVTIILRDETALEIQDVEVKAEEPEVAGKGEESAGVPNDIPVNVHNTELVDEVTVEQSYQEPSHEEAEPKIAVEDEKSEDNPEMNHMTVEEVLDEPKITSRDFNEEQIIEGNVASSTPESIEEDTIKSSQHNKKETIELKEEGSCTGSTNEESASDHIREYIPEDATKQIKDEDYNAVKSENETLEDSKTIEVHEICETKNIEKSEEIFSTLPVKYDEGQQGEGCSPAPTEALKEENINEDTLSVKVAKDDGNSGAVTIIETSAEVPSNDEDDSPEVLQKYEPKEEISKLLDVKPEETTPGSSSENVEVITCKKEEIQESLNISSGEVLETTTIEALPEIQIVEDTAETTTKLQACVQAAELNTEGEKENSEEQTSCEVSSSLIGEISEQKEEEEKPGHVECKNSIEEAKSETLEDTTIQEEESKNSFSSEKEIEKEIQAEYRSTVRSFDSKVKCDETGLTEASTEDKEQVETTQIATEEKGNEGIDACNTKMVGEVVEPSFQVKTLEEEATTKLEVEDETDKSNDLPEASNKICVEVLDEPKITDRDFNDEQITDGNVTNLTTELVEEHETVKDHQGEEIEIEKLNGERSGTENIKEGNANDSSTKCVPGDIDEKLKECIEEVVESKEQITEGNVETLTPESINEDTVKNSQDSEKETTELKEEGSCKESIKEENASELSPEYKEDTLKSKEEILEDSEIEETLSTLPVVQLLLQKQVQDNIDDDTCFVQQTKENDSAITITETSAEIPSNDEDDSLQVFQKYEPIKEHIKLRDVLPEETKPESSSENAEVVTCRKEEIEESLEDTKESDSTVEASMEATELSNEVEKQEHTTQEVSSSLLGEETTEESSKKEEKMEAHDECIEGIEETQEESNKTLTEDGSILLESSDDVIEKEIQGEYSSTVRSFNSEVVSEERGSTEATEQVEATHIAPEEDIEGTDVYNTELVGETIEPSSRVQTLEEEEAEDETDKADDHPEKSDKICEEVSNVLDEPKITDTDHGVQSMEGNVGSCASGSVEEETVKNDQAECVPAEVIVEERTGEAIESKEEFLQESQKDDKDEETFQIKEAGHNDDYNGTVVLQESGTEVPSIGEESSEVTQILELGEEHAQVEASDLADEIEACNLLDKVSVAEGTEEMTSREVEASNLALEKLNSDAPEEETIESCEEVPESVSKDEVPVDQKLDEGVPKKPSTLLSEEQELRASEHEQTKEVEVPTEEDTGDLLAARSAKEICLPEEPRELKVSELAAEKLDAGETEEETKETSETVTISDSQNIGAVCEDEIITDQTQCEEEKELDSELVQETLEADAPEEETKDGSAVVPKLDSDSLDEHVKEEIIADQTPPEGISTEQLQIPYTALLPEEKELEASEYRHETTSVDKNIEEENPKEVEVPADEDKQESCTSTPTETCLHTEEPRDTELAMHKPDAGESEEEKVVTKSDTQSAVVASGDEIVTDQTVCKEKTETPLSQERELGASELALEKLAAVDIEEIKEGPEIVPKFDSGIIEVVSNDEITIDETFNEGIVKEQIQSPSSTLLPEEKENKTSEPEHETTAQDQSSEQECTTEVELSADEDTQALLAARPVEKECLLKEEASELSVSELAVEKLDAGDTEESNGTFETVSTSDFPSIVEEPKEEITVDETLSKEVTDIPLEIPSYASLNKEKEPKASELDLEKLDADTPEEVKGSEMIPQSVSQSSCEVTKDEIIADQLEIPSSALLSDEKELKASEHEHETIINEKNLEDENLKEVKEPTDEASEYVFVARSVEETCLQKEEPSELEVPEANETEEVKDTFETVSESDSQSINAVSKDDSIADQTVSDVITDMPLDIPLPNENEEVKEDATKLALEKLDTDGTEDVKEGSEVTPKSDFQSIDVVVNDEIITDQVLPESITTEQLLLQSPTLLPEEKELKETDEHEHGTAIQDKNLEEEYAKETEVVADEDTRDVFAASSEETTHLQKEESRELKVSELSPECEEEITATFESTDAVSKEETITEQLVHQHDEKLLASPTLVPKEEEEAIVHKEEREDSKVLELSLKGETEEETKEAFEPAPEVYSQSIGELATDEIVDQIPPSLVYEEKRCENTTSINNAGEESMNVVETPNDESRKDPHSAEETSIPNEEPKKLNVSDLEFPSSQYTERDSSNEEKNLEVATSDSRAEDSCDTPIEANQTAKVEVMNEEIKDEKEVTKDSQLISVDEENVREIQQQNESREEKYPEEKNDTFTAPTEYHHEVPGSWIGDIEKEVKPDDKSFKDHSPDEAEGRIQETATHLGLESQGDEINCGSSTTEITIPVEKASSVEISQGVPGLEEANGTAQDTKQLEKESHATDNPSSKDDALNILQDPKLKDTKPSNDTLVARETKEEKFCESGTETVDSTSAQISLSEILMEESTKERMKAVTHLTAEKEPKLQVDEEEEEDHENVEEAKTDEEKEDFEHRRAYQGYDEPVIVEASRDTEVKVSTKKSHNILSGMGKSVKHSISKVKKAIIGKSSNSKTQSDK
uniref:titin isoform X1 n=1 Tax=Fragaria vesca subsp. vesca TaxID=101020 RepID=UPI0005CAAA7D|nr:PREDICTED: titin isoform X1 [Fragaria vesca subsp. vesca]